MESSSAGALSLQSILTGKNRPTWEDKKFWQKLCPNLTITDGLSVGASSFGTKEEYQRRKERLVDDGYVLVDDTIEGEEATQSLADAITELHKRHSLPATFVLLFDETWRLAAKASSLLSNSTNPNNLFNFDMLAWYIDPREGAAGFSPHRDRQPDDVKGSFHDDKMAKYVTMWLALSNATPENSCLYVIPKPYDPGYTDGDDESDDGPDPLTRALPEKCAYQNIRALPREAGQSLLFTHRILHWGSRGNPNSHDKTPRVAISFVCSDPSFEKPYLNNFSMLDDDHLPPFKIRLLLVCAQFLIYYQRFDLPKDCIKACHDYVKENEDILEESYRKKVYIEFIKAMQEEQDPRAAMPVDSGEADKTGATNDETGSDEEDEAVLEAMLDAEAGGYGDFEDDFDEIEGDEDAEEHAVEDGDEDFDETDDEPGLLFGKRGKESPENNPSKKMKG